MGKNPGQMIVWWDKLIAVLKKNCFTIDIFQFLFFTFLKKLLFRNIWYNVHKIIYWFMGKMIQVAFWLNIIYLRYSTSSTFFMQSKPISYLLPLKILESNYLALLCISCQCFGHRLLYYCQIVLAVFSASI